MSWLPVTAHSEMQEERDKWREEPASKREPGLDNWGNSQTLQIAKKCEIRRFTQASGLWREKRVWLVLHKDQTTGKCIHTEGSLC